MRPAGSAVNTLKHAARLFNDFFSSKEEYVYEVIQHRRKKIPEFIRMVLNGKEKAGPAEARAYLIKIYVLASEGKDILHREACEVTLALHIESN